MSRAIDDLLHEHEAILSALNLLAGINRKLETASPVDPGDLTAFVGFLKEFADKCHHGKEEGLLFPAMAEAGVPQAGGPLGVMLREHEEGRRWIAAMSAAIEPRLDATAFVQAAQGYTELLQAHIGKENQVLFPMAERVLSPAHLDSLFQAFEEHESKVIGHGRHEELHGLLESLKNKYVAG
jgi:hemerythrin-like domain-containing protein